MKAQLTHVLDRQERELREVAAQLLYNRQYEAALQALVTVQHLVTLGDAIAEGGADELMIDTHELPPPPAGPAPSE